VIWTWRGLIEPGKRAGEIRSGLVGRAAAASIDRDLLVGRGGVGEPFRSFVVVGDDAPVRVSTEHPADKRVGCPRVE
jgi:hypothetical protein